MLRIAACQLPVSDLVPQNAQHILQQMEEATQSGAQVVQFPECALSGYAGFNFDSFEKYDWDALSKWTKHILQKAETLKVWVILGSSHRLTGTNKPHNSLYLINPQGEVVDRYDKRFCMGPTDTLDMKHYSPGSRFVDFNIQGIQCGLMICHDWRYPELYRQYKKRGAQVIFQSWYDGNLSSDDYETSGKDLGQLIQASAQCHAACNAVWICGTNTSKPESCFGAFLVQPDGKMTQKAIRNEKVVLIDDIDPHRSFDDPAKPSRDRAIDGILSSGQAVCDPRSEDRTCI